MRVMDQAGGAGRRRASSCVNEDELLFAIDDDWLSGRLLVPSNQNEGAVVTDGDTLDEGRQIALQGFHDPLQRLGSAAGARGGQTIDAELLGHRVGGLGVAIRVEDQQVAGIERLRLRPVLGIDDDAEW